MNEAQVREILQTALDQVAPGVELGAAGADDDLRRVLDLDSLDFLNLIVAVDARLGLHTREEDYPRLSTLRGCVGYLTAASTTAR